ncbi:MAG: TetR/AcrR family transcriptional regulator [Fidelibacterota bacterium]
MISPRQLEEREARKKRIIQGALQVFQEKGLEAATMDEIASVAGFGKATLYYYFSSKEEVFSQIMEQGWKALWTGIEEMIHLTGSSARERFIQTLNKIAEITLTDRNLYSFLFSAHQTLAGAPAELQSWKTYQERIYGALKGLLEEGISQGEFPPLNANVLLRAIGGLFHGLMFLGNRKHTLKKADIEQLIARLLDAQAP